jgi:hypothetical protein
MSRTAILVLQGSIEHFARVKTMFEVRFQAVEHLVAICTVADGDDLALLGSADQTEGACPKEWDICKISTRK